MDENKVTWRFAWSLYWKMLLMGLGITFVIWLIVVIVFMALGVSYLCPVL